VTAATGSTAGTAATGATAATGSTGTSQQGSVLGTTASRHGKGNAGPQGGVLGALQSVGHGSLPFTGFPLWVAVIAALALIALGLTVRRQARVTA